VYSGAWSLDIFSRLAERDWQPSSLEQGLHRRPNSTPLGPFAAPNDLLARMT